MANHRINWHSAAVTILVLIGSVAFGAYTFVHWTEKQILNTDNWVNLVTPLPKQPVVYTALGTYIGNQVFEAAPVQSEIADALPPRASFLAGPLTSQLQSLTVKTAQKVVASDAFQTIWSGANRVAMNRLLTTSRGKTPPLQAKLNQKFNINLSDTKGQLSSALGSLSSAIPALQPASQKALAVSTNLRIKADRLHQVIRGIDFLAAVLPLFVAACLLWALAIARNRRKATLSIVVVLGLLMLLELIAVKGLRQSVLNQVHDSANLQAVGYIYDVLVSWLKNMIYAVLGVVVAIYIIGVLAGSSSWARAVQQFIRVDRLRSSQPMAWWHTIRSWVGRYQYYLWLGALVVVLVCMAAFVSIGWRSTLNALLLLASLFAVFHIVATPRPKIVAKK